MRILTGILSRDSLCSVKTERMGGICTDGLALDRIGGVGGASIGVLDGCMIINGVELW